jgi:hypothetical protein
VSVRGEAGKFGTEGTERKAVEILFKNLLHAVVFEGLVAEGDYLGGDDGEAVVFEEGFGGDADVGVELGVAAGAGELFEVGHEGAADAGALVVGADEEAVDVAGVSEFCKAGEVAGFIFGEEDMIARGAGLPGGFVDDVRRPGGELGGGIVLHVDAVDGVAVEGDHAGDVGGEGAAGGGHGSSTSWSFSSREEDRRDGRIRCNSVSVMLLLICTSYVCYCLV